MGAATVEGRQVERLHDTIELREEDRPPDAASLEHLPVEDIDVELDLVRLRGSCTEPVIVVPGWREMWIDHQLDWNAPVSWVERRQRPLERCNEWTTACGARDASAVLARRLPQRLLHERVRGRSGRKQWNC